MAAQQVKKPEQKKMSGWTKLLLVVVLIGIFWFVWWFLHRDTSTSMTFDELRVKLKSGFHFKAGSKVNQIIEPGIFNKYIFVLDHGNVSQHYHLILPGSRILNDEFQSLADHSNTVWSPKGPSHLGRTLLQLSPMILIAIFFFWSISRMGKQSQGEGGMPGGFSSMMIGGSNFAPGESKIRFADVAGIEEEKQELLEVVDYMKDPDKYKLMGARTPRGVMLYGPPGTGKTLMAKAVAGEAKVAFLEISGSAVSGIISGAGAQRIRMLFKAAAKKAPCIVFIDEIDTIGRKRGMSINQSSDDQQTLNQLLTSMDGFGTHSGVVVMAATNRLQDLDDALLRPGRFDRQIQVTLPDLTEREAILAIHAKNKNISKKVKLSDIARRTPGFSGAQLENTLNEAAFLTVRTKKRAIGMIEIEEAIERSFGGPSKRRRSRNKFTQELIAYHEAGHAITTLVELGSDAVEKITIVSRGSAGGYVMRKSEDNYNMRTKQDYEKDMIIACGGRVAEEIVFGKDRITSGASSDFDTVTRIARAMVTQMGMSSLGIVQFENQELMRHSHGTKPYSDALAEQIDEEVNKIARTAYDKSKKLVLEYRETFDLIGEALLICESMSREEVQYIFEQKQIPTRILDMKTKELPEEVLEVTTSGTKKTEEDHPSLLPDKE